MLISRPTTLACLTTLLITATVLSDTPPARPQGAESQVKISALAPADLDAALHGGTWLIVEFGGEHCIPCTRMQPVLQDLQAALGAKARIHNFWIQQHPDVAARFKIMVMPTQVVFKPDGEEAFRHMGYFPPEEFRAALRERGLL
jgi:thioredoxin 1